MELILASTSPYRRALLDRLGVSFRCLAPPVDEDRLKQDWPDISPRKLAERLAMAKARSVSAIVSEAVVIGCDQLVSLEGSILGKPGTIEGAIAQLEQMSGRTHDLITAMVVVASAKTYAHINVTKLRMRELTAAEVLRYVEFDRPIDCAGSYKLESRGIALFDQIKSSDHSAITGLPLIALTSILRKIGLAIP